MLYSSQRYKIEKILELYQKQVYSSFTNNILLDQILLIYMYLSHHNSILYMVDNPLYRQLVHLVIL